MCSFFIYGKIPTERNELKINFIDTDSNSIKKISIGEILKIHDIQIDNIHELIVMVSAERFDMKLVDISLSHQIIENAEVVKLCDYNNNKYFLFDDDILIQDNIYTRSLINELISSKYNYFLICIKYIDNRKLRLKKNK